MKAHYYSLLVATEFQLNTGGYLPPDCDACVSDSMLWCKNNNPGVNLPKRELQFCDANPCIIIIPYPFAYM